MSPENIDFTAILANMEAKRGALDAAIASLRAAIVSGALLGAVSGDLIGAPVTTVGITQNAEIPNGAFLGKTVSQAIKLYLSIVLKKQTTRQIVEALKRGGVESKSDKFGNIVYNNLTRMEKVTGEIAKVNQEWGLAEWYHPGIRTPTGHAGQAGRKGPNVKQKSVGSQVTTSKRLDEGLPSRIKKLLESKPDSSYGPAEIASALGVKPIAVNVRLKRMLERGQITKVGLGQYRAVKTSVVKMPAAG